MQADKADMTLGNYRTGPRTCTRISAYTKIALGNFTPSKVSAPTEVEVFSSYDVAVVKIVPVYTCTCISIINNGKAGKVRDTGSAEPGLRPFFGSVSGSENNFCPC